MDIHEPCIGHGGNDLCAEKFLRPITIQPVDAVHDLWLRLGESLGESFSQKEVLGGTGATLLAQHPLYAAVAGSAVVE